MPVRLVRTSLNASRRCARSSTRALIIWRAFALSAKNAHRSLQADSLHRCLSRVRECPGQATMEALQKIYKGRFSRSVEEGNRKVKEVSHAAITRNPRHRSDTYTQWSLLYDDTGRPGGRGHQD